MAHHTALNRSWLTLLCGVIWVLGAVSEAATTTTTNSSPTPTPSAASPHELVSSSAWREVFSDLENCTSAGGFCKKTHSEKKHVYVHQRHGNQEECSQNGGDWNVRFQSWQEFRNASIEFENAADDTALLTFLLRFDSKHRINTHNRMHWRHSLNISFHDHMRCHGKHYAHVIMTKQQAVSPSVREISHTIILLPPAVKISPSVHAAVGDSTKNSVTLLISVHSGDVFALARKWASQFPSIVKDNVVADGPDLIIWSNIPRDSVTEISEYISKQSDVYWVEPKLDVHHHNKYAQYITQSGTTTVRTLFDKGLQGQNQIVGVADSGLDYNHCFFRDPSKPVSVATGGVYLDQTNRKVVQYFAFADNTEGKAAGHGTHVCGSIAGNDITNTKSDFNGMAPQAKLAFFDIGVTGQTSLSVPGSIERNMFPQAYSAGARLHSNSWGASSNTYDSMARDVDRYSFNNQDFLVLVAAGNDGDEGAGSVGTPATAKNCVTVGAEQNSDASYAGSGRACSSHTPCQDNVAAFSSQGPRFDGAIAPDIVAPGQLVVSSLSAVSGSTCEVVAFQGTSMATPVTSGNAALIRQYFMEGWYPTGRKTDSNRFTPMGSLVKAVLVNSGRVLAGLYGSVQIDPSGPGNIQGFGAIQLNSTLFFSDSSRELFVIGDFNNQLMLDDGSAPHMYNFTLDSPVMDMKITLVWTDASGTVGSRQVLINDLDLEASCTSGCSSSRTLYPNKGASADRINNVEQITIPASSLSPDQVYRVTIKAFSVPQGPQPYSLVVTGNFKQGTGGGGGGGGGGNGGNGDGNNGGGNKVSWGVVTCSLLAAAAGSYVIVAVAIGKRRHGRWGFPPSHQVFWRGVGSNVKGGVVFVGSGVAGLFRSGAKKANGVSVAKQKSTSRSAVPVSAAGVGASSSYMQAPNQKSAATTTGVNRFNQPFAPASKPAAVSPFATPASPPSTPKSAAGSYVPPKPTAPKLPPKSPAKSKWTVHIDPVSGNRYWYNPDTKESTWTDPN